MILDGKYISSIIKNELKEEIINNQLKPGLGIILVGNKKESEVYIRMKKKSCEEIGITKLFFNFSI